MGAITKDDLLGTWRIIKSIPPMNSENENFIKNFRCKFEEEKFIYELPENTDCRKNIVYHYALKDGWIEGVSKGGSKIQLKIEKSELPGVLIVTAVSGGRDWIERVEPPVK